MTGSVKAVPAAASKSSSIWAAFGECRTVRAISSRKRPGFTNFGMRQWHNTAHSSARVLSASPREMSLAVMAEVDVAPRTPRTAWAPARDCSGTPRRMNPSSAALMLLFLLTDDGAGYRSTVLHLDSGGAPDSTSSRRTRRTPSRKSVLRFWTGKENSSMMCCL